MSSSLGFSRRPWHIGGSSASERIEEQLPHGALARPDAELEPALEQQRRGGRGPVLAEVPRPSFSVTPTLYSTNMCSVASRRTGARGKEAEGVTVREAQGSQPVGVRPGEMPRSLVSGEPVKWSAVERESEGVVVVTMGGTTQPDRSEGPLLRRCAGRKGVEADECPSG